MIYAAALASEKVDDEGDYIKTRPFTEAYQDVITRLEKLVDDIDASDAIVCLSKGRSFRYALEPTYKSNRANLCKPALVEPLKDELIERRKPFGVLAIPGLEADDICGISSTALQRADLREPVIVSIDKDMQTVPGLSYSWLREDDGIVETTEQQADMRHLVQTLMGDPVDGYAGCPGIGKARATKALTGVEDLWATVLSVFADRDLGAHYALTQARLAYILRDSNWDITKREIKLWQPPSVTAAHETMRLVTIQ